MQIRNKKSTLGSKIRDTLPFYSNNADFRCDMIQSYFVALPMYCMSNEIYEFFYVFYFHSNFRMGERGKREGGKGGDRIRCYFCRKSVIYY